VPVVVDASVALAWILPDERPAALAALQRIRDDEGVAPALWWYEMRNGLVVNERRGRLTLEETERALRDLSSLTIAIDRSPDEEAVMALARRHRLTVYDAAYLELAMRRNLPLATLDAALVQAARAERVALVGDDQP
jgi:predicted nucleic acid-binding protein